MGALNSSEMKVGYRFGKYALLQEIGHGVFGTVFRATAGFSSRRVAVKIFKPERYAAAERELAVFDVIKEAQSPFLCFMRSFAIVNKHVIIEFPLLYKSVYDVQHSNDDAPFLPRVVAQVAADVTRGLQALHAIGIAHGDLKPENIVFTDNKCEHVQIIDFGLAVKTPFDAKTYIQSRFYRAPEIVLGLQFSTAIDMWSLGCLLPELASGRVLFRARDEAHLAAYHKGLNGEFPKRMRERSLRSKRFFESVGGPCVADVPLPDTAFGSFVHRCLVVDPANRITARAALQLEAHRGGIAMRTV